MWGTPVRVKAQSGECGREENCFPGGEVGVCSAAGKLSVPKLALSGTNLKSTCLDGGRGQLSKTEDPTYLQDKGEKMVSILTSTLRFHLNDCHMVKTSEITSF